MIDLDKVLDYIRDCNKQGFSPTLSEIGSVFPRTNGMPRSGSVVSYWIGKLEHAGKLERVITPTKRRVILAKKAA